MKRALIRNRGPLRAASAPSPLRPPAGSLMTRPRVYCLRGNQTDGDAPVGRCNAASEFARYPRHRPAWHDVIGYSVVLATRFRHAAGVESAAASG